MAEDIRSSADQPQNGSAGREGYDGPRALPGERTMVKDISWCGVAYGCGSSCVDVKDGKITRIRPLNYEMNYDRKDFNAWKMEARGKTFEPPMKEVVGPIGLAYKKRVYSKNRVRYPLKRVDWTPTASGTRRTGARAATSASPGTKPPSSSERMVGIKTYGPEAVLSQPICTGRRCAPSRTAAPTGCSPCSAATRSRCATRTAGKAGPGAPSTSGAASPSARMPAANLFPTSPEQRFATLLGVRPGDHPIWHGQWPAALLLVHRDRHQVRLHLPRPQLWRGVHADKWIPILPNTDAALHLAIAYMWITEGTYDKEYIATHAYGFDKFEDYVLGKDDGVPKTPKWALRECGVPEWTIKALAKTGPPRDDRRPGNGGPGIRGPTRRNRPAWKSCSLACRAWANRASTRQR